MKNASQSITRTLLIPIGLGLLLPVMVTSCQGCKKDEPPPPLPSATAPAATSAPTLELAVEDAAVPDVDDADAGRRRSRREASASNLKKCCQAIKQNAANAPMPTKAYLENLAATCFAMCRPGRRHRSPPAPAIRPPASECEAGCSPAGDRNRRRAEQLAVPFEPRARPRSTRPMRRARRGRSARSPVASSA